MEEAINRKVITQPTGLNKFKVHGVKTLVSDLAMRQSIQEYTGITVYGDAEGEKIIKSLGTPLFLSCLAGNDMELDVEHTQE